MSVTTIATEANAAAPSREPLIALRGLGKSFALPGGKRLQVLDGITLEVHSGEFVALLGRSGSGKSTLLRCIAGLIAPTEGEVLFGGTPVTSTNRGTAMVFQTFALLPWLTVQQNVELGLEARHVNAIERAARALRAIDIVGLDGYETAFPKELSGGMRQRVGFARALVVEPEVLLMDEPFSALDVLTAENLRGELLELWEGKRFPTKSIVMVTHNIEEAVLLADRILVLGTNPGRIRAEMVNPLPRPRQRRTPSFDELVDRIYAIMTGRAEPDGSAPAVVRAPSGTPGDTPLPHATVDGLSGLTEILSNRGGGADLADLASLLGLEVDDLLPLVDSLVLLGFAELNADHVRLTATGDVFAGANIQNSKSIFARAALDHAPLVRTIARALRGCLDGNLPSGFFLDLLRRSFGEEEAATQLNVAINWGRYAELYSYDAERGQIIRDEHVMQLVHEGTNTTPRGTLRVYLGAAPGVGKTVSMLREGHARRSLGEDVVVAIADTRNRPRTTDELSDLEVLPPQRVDSDAGPRDEIDLAAVLSRHPRTALVDDLEHVSHVAGVPRRRYDDVEALREAGIDVITTLDITHVSTVSDLTAEVTGVAAGDTVPDSVLGDVDEIQLVDVSPVALRKRLRHGNIYPEDEVDAAMDTSFDAARLAALREIALRFISDGIDAAHPTGRASPRDALVAVGNPEHLEHLINQGARLARRSGGRCTVLAVSGRRNSGALAKNGAPVPGAAMRVGAAFMERSGGDPARIIEQVARELLVRDVVIGRPAQRPGLGRFRHTLADELLRSLPDVDLHVITPAHERALDGSPGAAGDSHVSAPRAPAPALRIYLGYARGCGATSAMLEEAHRRASRGTDVVVAGVQTHGQSAVQDALAGLEVLEAGDSLDVPATLARHPQVACIDDLAASTVGGGTRWQAVRALLGAGITVIATLHAADLSSWARAEPGARGDGPRPQLDDDVILTVADEMELVDVAPAALIDRIRRGRVDAGTQLSGLSDDDLTARLTRLRDHAFHVVAGYADRQLVRYMHDEHVDEPWEASPRVLACVAPRSGYEALVRTAAQRSALADGRLFVATVRDDPSRDGDQSIERYAQLAAELGGEYTVLDRGAIARALAGYAREQLITEVMLGRGRARAHRRGGVVLELVRLVGDADIHIVPLTAE